MADEVRILHAADIHLDSPLRGLDGTADEQTVHELRRATAGALHNLVDLALQEQPSAVAIAGDLYDGDAKDYQTGRTFVREMQRLEEADIPVMVIAGNHDAASVITRSLTPPPNVHVFSTDRPERFALEDRGLVFHGQGFPDRAVDENLVANYPKRVPGLINVGLLHTSLAGYAEHDTYAPCSLDDIAATEYEYMAMGHIHKRGDPFVVGSTTAAFSGNLQGRHIRETGPKGAYLVTLGEGEQPQLEFVALDVARWEVAHVDTTDASDLSDVLDRTGKELREIRAAAGSRVVAVRVMLNGTSEAAYELADHEKLREEIKAIAEPLDIAVNKVKNNTTVPTAPRMLSLANRADLKAAKNASELSEPLLRKTLSKLETAIKPALKGAKPAGDDLDVDFEALREDALRNLIARLESGR